jgi:hypothetical protein
MRHVLISFSIFAYRLAISPRFATEVDYMHAERQMPVLNSLAQADEAPACRS